MSQIVVPTLDHPRQQVPRSLQRLAALSIGAAASVIVLACIGMLTWSYATARIRAPGDEQRVLELQEKVRMDATFASELADEQAMQTEFRQHRAASDARITIILLLASTTFVASMKWLVSLRDRLVPLQSQFVQLRLPPRAPAAGARSGASRRPVSGEVSAIDLSHVDRIVAEIGRSAEAAIPILQAIQSTYRYLPDDALQRVCELTETTPAQIAGTSSFYKQLRRTPIGEHFVRVCHGTACHVAGARQVTDELRRHLEIPEGADTDPQQRFTLDEVACLGCCSLAPVLMIDEHTAGRLTSLSAYDALQTFLAEHAS